MPTDVAGENPAPIACSLDAGEYCERMAWLRELSRDALLAHELDDLELTLVYDSAHSERVMEFVRRERSCCGFLEFDVAAEPDEVRVHVRAPEAARPIALELLQEFIGTKG